MVPNALRKVASLAKSRQSLSELREVHTHTHTVNEKPLGFFFVLLSHGRWIKNTLKIRPSILPHDLKLRPLKIAFWILYMPPFR
jgi:hypothetical protein